MDTDGRCADDGDAVQCVVLACMKEGIRGRGYLGEAGRTGGVWHADVSLFIAPLFAVDFSI
jgi:hypothetical protein